MTSAKKGKEVAGLVMEIGTLEMIVTLEKSLMASPGETANSPISLLTLIGVWGPLRKIVRYKKWIRGRVYLSYE